MHVVSPKEKALAASLGLVSAIAIVAVIAVPLFIRRAESTRGMSLASADNASTSSGGGAGATRGMGGSQKSVAGTSSAESGASSSQTSTRSANAPSPGPASNDDTTATGPTGGGGTTPGTDPSPDPTPDPQPKTSMVTGRVVHEVWGTPLSGVYVALAPSGRTGRTDAMGFFTFAGLPADTATRVTISAEGAWLSHSPISMEFVTAPLGSHRADFALYATSEAGGRDWADAAAWRGASDGELATALSKVNPASAAFEGLSVGDARSVLAAGKNGSGSQKARAELLATWLDMATSRLGFDTPVDTASVPGGADYFSASRTALSLVRSADSAITRGDGLDWNAVRRVLTARSLSGQQTPSGAQSEEPGKSKGSKK